MKVILNKCFGGFDVSDEAYELYAKKSGVTLFRYVENTAFQFERDDGEQKYRNPFLTYYFLEDFGKYTNRNEINWDKQLYLNSDKREDKILISVVEELGDRASGRFGELVVVEIPDGMDYVIDEYDGIETLHQRVKEW